MAAVPTHSGRDMARSSRRQRSRPRLVRTINTVVYPDMPEWLVADGAVRMRGLPVA